MSSFQFSQPHHMITVKLDDTNYSLWRAQFLPYLQGHDLDGYVTGATPCPTETLTADLPNPAYLSWRKQDKLLVSWLFSSLTPATFRHVHRLTTSKEIWSSLESLYGSKSDAQVHHLHCELRALRKGSQTMRQYIDRARDLVDSLAAADTTVTDKEFRHCLLAGLDSTYDAIVTSLTTTMSSLSVEDFLTFLLTFELRIDQQTKLSNSQPVANLAAQNRQSSYHSFSSSGSSSAPNSQSSCFRSTGNNRNQSHHGPGSSQPARFQNQRGPASPDNQRGPITSDSSSPRCQLCGRKNHEAQDCWNRYDKSFRPPRRQPPSSAPRAYAAYGPGFSSSPSWTPDSGATDHITNDFSRLQFPTEYTGPNQIQMGNGSSIPISNVGSSILGTPNRKLQLRNVLFTPKISHNLLSVSRFTTDNNVLFEFHPNFCLVKDRCTGKVLLRGIRKGGVYQLDVSSPVPQAYIGERASLQAWHARMGHPMMRTVRKVISQFSLPVSNQTISFCSFCHEHRSHKLPFQSSTTVYLNPLDLILSDVWGPSHILSNEGYKYYIIFIDAYSHFTWMFPMSQKSDVFSIFFLFQKHVENLFGRKIKIFQSDNPAEYRKLTPHLQELGIFHRFSCPHTSEQNGLVERRHRHIRETGLTILNMASVPFSYWYDSFYTACYLMNRVPSTSVHNSSPYEALFGISPDYTSLRVFGCLCYPHLRPYRSHKMDALSSPCVFIGYSPSHKGYKCLHLPTGRIYISRHVVFDETTFPFASASSPSPSSTPSQVILPFSALHNFVPSLVPINHQPPVSNHQLPASNHQPPASNHQPPKFNHQPPTSISNHQPPNPVSNHQPPNSVSNHQPSNSVSNHQPSPAVTSQPTTFSNHSLPVSVSHSQPSPAVVLPLSPTPDSVGSLSSVPASLPSSSAA